MPLLAMDHRRQGTMFGANQIGMRMDEEWLVVWVETGLEEMQRYLRRSEIYPDEPFVPPAQRGPAS